MTAIQRRKAVEVARDVLLQLRLERLTTTGGYLRVQQNSQDFNPPEEVYNGSFKTAFQQDKSIVCGVCAIGAAYIGYINRFNRVKTCDVLSASDDDMILTMKNVFSEDQLRLMEGFFENGFVQTPSWYYDLDSGSAYKVSNLISDFCNRYPERTQRLRAIMLNVIRNDGEFRIPLRMRTH
jgi:hypothetical protein